MKVLYTKKKETKATYKHIHQQKKTDLNHKHPFIWI